jgi:hypothetical protein
MEEITESGMYTLSYVELNDPSNKKVYRILRDENDQYKKYYYLDFRRPAGHFTNFDEEDPVANGLSIRIGPEEDVTGYRNTYLLDNTPETDDFWDAALLEGAVFEDEENELRIYVVEASENNITIRVIFGDEPTPCSVLGCKEFERKIKPKQTVPKKKETLSW